MPPQALATARSQAKTDDAQRGGLELAEILASLDRSEEAHQELERLRASGAPHAEIDRRLALLAFNSGDYKEAKQRFSDLLSSGEGNDGAQLYLADIALRDGDPDAALAAYRRLYALSLRVPGGLCVYRPASAADRIVLQALPPPSHEPADPPRG